MSDHTSPTNSPEERARRRAENWAGLWWHVTVFVVVNAFLWMLDLLTGDGITWAYWATGPWAIGLLFHVVNYVLEDRGVEGRKYQQYLAEERERDARELEHH